MKTVRQMRSLILLKKERKKKKQNDLLSNQIFKNDSFLFINSIKKKYISLFFLNYYDF